MNPKKIILFLLLFFARENLNAQQLQNRLEIGIDAGYRTLRMTDINNYYGYEVYGNPIHGALITSFFTSYRPRKNGKMMITFSVDHYPDYNNNAKGINWLDTSYSGSYIVYDSTHDELHTTITYTMLQLHASFDIPFKKFVIQLGAGITYNFYKMTASGHSTWYHKLNNESYNKVQDTSTNSILNKESGPGLVLLANVKYQLAKRWYLHANCSWHYCNMDIKEADGSKIKAPSGFFGTSSIGFYYDQYQQVQLSGIAFSAGISYTIL